MSTTHPDAQKNFYWIDMKNPDFDRYCLPINRQYLKFVYCSYRRKLTTSHGEAHMLETLALLLITDVTHSPPKKRIILEWKKKN
jgi:hypothetical protein